MEPFKNAFNAGSISALAERIVQVHPAFDVDAFRGAAGRGIDQLELKARVDQIAHAVRAHLPEHVPTALDILVATLGDPFDPEVPNSGSFQVWPLTRFVAHHGTDHPTESLAALHAMTQRFTGEFALRPLLRLHPELTLRTLHEWTSDPAEHVRRLVSEGTRTRLPWGERLEAFIADPSPVLPLLEALRSDPAEYVRRSVANNLNDLSKDHVELVLQTTRRWSQETADPNRKRLVRHALRTLIKEGHPEAMEVIGFSADVPIEVADWGASERVALGESLEISVSLHNPSREDAPVLLDLQVHLVRANGSRTAKVFKWTTRTLKPGARVHLKKKLPLRPVTTRRYYPGTHRVELQINGVVHAGSEFELKCD